MLGVREAHVFPGAAAVETQVDARPVADVPAADVLARAHPDRVRIVGIDRDAADRVGVLVVEDRFPGRPRVDRLPDAAAADADVPGALVVRVDRDIGDSPRHECRPDAAHFQSLERLFVESRFDVLVVGGKHRKRNECEHGSNKRKSLHDFPCWNGLAVVRRDWRSLTVHSKR